MPKYNKLVRDKIPDIINQTGKKYTSDTLSTKEYKIALKAKLHEEVAEYQEASNDAEAIEELADILELLHSAAVLNGSSIEEVERVRLVKKEKRGGFEKRIKLIEVQDES